MNKNLNTAPDWSLEDSMRWVADFKAAAVMNNYVAMKVLL